MLASTMPSEAAPHSTASICRMLGTFETPSVETRAGASGWAPPDAGAWPGAEGLGVATGYAPLPKSTRSGLLETLVITSVAD